MFFFGSFRNKNTRNKKIKRKRKEPAKTKKIQPKYHTKSNR